MRKTTNDDLAVMRWWDSPWRKRTGIVRLQRAFSGLDDLCLSLGAIERHGVPLDEALDTYLRPLSRSEMRRLKGDIDDLLKCFPTEPEVNWVVRNVFGRLDTIFHPTMTPGEQLAALAQRLQQERHTKGHPHCRDTYDAAL